MEAIVLSADQFSELVTKINELIEKFERGTAAHRETFVDNKKFLEIMGVSQRTGQAWRDEGKIAFSQVGKKIYYKMSDVEKFLNEHHNQSFAK
ncbi:DNA-binding protein [Flavobacteriaceae bacterium JJC]|uniref:helix-turn-helix domain-containing protein n=1 Tax=Kaistella soli TaxID=2849654 RepID=UPI000B4B2F19|nr:helix-turn-helix domain-containing protein [Kaistella soli]MBU8882371.1 helix-turn-helix domain-containing protein [Kaistella soli]OWK73142.1 DNA-binding protein [Flavobacteriaceae bacterium JJC]